MSTDDALVELVARAQYAAYRRSGAPVTLDGLPAKDHDYYRKGARAVLSALRDAGALPDKEVAEQLIRALAHNHWQAAEMGRLREGRDKAIAEVDRLTDAAVIVQCEHPEMDGVLAELESVRADRDAYWARLERYDQAGVDEKIGAVERVRALHVKHYTMIGNPVCVENGYFVPYPCPTMRALDGDETAEKGTDRG